ncbi:MAG: hypothetical protein AB1424_17665 [Thermodesulfobacteriota bacterium]
MDRRDKLIAFLLAAVVLIAGYWWMVIGVCGIFHDDAIYVSTAKALATGQGYRLINLPGAPFQTKYPLLYPAILAFIWKLWPSFPSNLLAMQALSLLAGGAVTGLVYLYLVRFGYCTRGVALAAGLLCATSFNFLYFSTITFSEIPFALILLAGLWALEEQVRAPRSSIIRQLFLGILLALPFMCRTIGVSLAPVGLFCLYRHRRPVRWVAMGASVLICPWLIWTQAISFYVPGDLFTEYYTNYLTWWYEHGLSFFMRILVYNVWYSMFASGYVGFPGLERSLFSLESLPLSVCYFLLGIITWIGITKNAIKQQILPLYLISYFGIIMFWPWPPFRFLVPLLPFLLAYLIGGILIITQRLTVIPGCRTAFIVAMGILLAANLSSVFIQGQINQKTRYPLLVRTNPPVHWSSHESMFNWLKLHTSPDDVIASGLDTMVYLYTGRRAFRPFVSRPAAMFYGDPSQSLGTPADLLQVMRAYRAHYLVHTPMPGFGEEKLFAALIKNFQLEYPGVLQPVFLGEDPRFVIFAVRPGPE